MANLSLTIDDDTLLRARRRSFDHGTSVNAVVCAYLDAYAAPVAGAEPWLEFVALASANAGTSGRSERHWTRDDAHAR